VISRATRSPLRSRRALLILLVFRLNLLISVQLKREEKGEEKKRQRKEIGILRCNCSSHTNRLHRSDIQFCTLRDTFAGSNFEDSTNAFDGSIFVFSWRIGEEFEDDSFLWFVIRDESPTGYIY
jgi:hypothetical protein